MILSNPLALTSNCSPSISLMPPFCLFSIYIYFLIPFEWMTLLRRCTDYPVNRLLAAISTSSLPPILLHTDCRGLVQLSFYPQPR
jgi:hypothetical protein